MFLQLIFKFELVYKPQIPWMMGSLGPLEEGHCQKCILWIFLPTLPYGLLPWYIEKMKIIKTFGEYWTLIPEDPKHPDGSSVE